ncbi:hypothetical protein [Pseudogemmobacter bohemicus]|uniref:hypothetical protein n=1 Tax=Pseudogemmobacter bohemicus TaxID=2250708 RepID=UPI0013002F19|nr:hypothetical protein [Pseudogemmobacter bohemicus]
MQVSVSTILHVARGHLAAENPDAYRRIVEGAIRCAHTPRAEEQLREAMAKDLPEEEEV